MTRAMTRAMAMIFLDDYDTYFCMRNVETFSEGASFAAHNDLYVAKQEKDERNLLLPETSFRRDTRRHISYVNVMNFTKPEAYPKANVFS